MKTSSKAKTKVSSRSVKCWVSRVKTDSTHPPAGLFTKDAATIALSFVPARFRQKDQLQGFGCSPTSSIARGRALVAPERLSWNERSALCWRIRGGLHLPGVARGRKQRDRSRRSMHRFQSRNYRVENRKIVVELKVCPGLSTVEGNAGWFGESGKCCVSRQNPYRWLYTFPSLPWIVPSKKLPVYN
jgi:hypothetical protein